ncbi:MAG: flavin reductase family protein [Candidatus Micrarchaeia archaeon]|jgi:flavin reductase (DIM6/NTAB) family NADH-FMN oxidoreductase RutF
MNAREGNLHHLFYPRQTVLVTSHLDGKDNAMVLDWTMPASFDPFMVAIAVGTSRHSCGMILKSEEFVLSIMPLSLKDKALYFGTHSGRDEDKFAATGLAKEKASKVKAPLIRDAIANFECHLSGHVHAGDHVIFVGEVLEARINKTALEKEKKLYNAGNRQFTGL